MLGEEGVVQELLEPAEIDHAIHKFQSGDAFAGKVLSEHIDRIVMRRLRRLNATEAEREEIAQETKLMVIQRLGEFDQDVGPFDGWVAGFAHNCWRAHIRSVIRLRRATVAMESISQAHYEIDEEVDQRENLQTAMDSLELIDRELLHMRYGLGMTSDEIAQNSDMNAPQIRKRISRAVERLRRHPATQALLASLMVS